MSRLKKAVLLGLSVLCIALCTCCGLYLYQFFRGARAHEDLLAQAQVPEVSTVPVEEAAPEQVPITVTEEEEAEPGPVLPVDFEVLQAANEEIYAWLEVPGTGISVPILQSASDDLFYNTHGVDKAYYTGGAVYTQRYNGLDFADPMTLVYGHNFHDKSIFAPLLNFMDSDFFAEHQELLVYTPEALYRYRIFAAYPHTSEHLLLCYDFGTEAGFDQYFSVLDQPVVNGSYRPEDFPVFGDKVLTLSTCYRLTLGQRYLVQAVLEETQEVRHEA